jgi:hypothetical protein
VFSAVTSRTTASTRARSGWAAATRSRTSRASPGWPAAPPRTAPPPPFGLLAAPATGGAQRAVGFRWDGDRRTTAFDGETHLRPLWYIRSRGRLEDTLKATDQWWQAHTEPPGQLLPRAEGCTIHPVRAGQSVDFAARVAGLVGLTLTGGVIQDPYLLSAHQIRCLETFLRAVR